MTSQTMYVDSVLEPKDESCETHEIDVLSSAIQAYRSAMREMGDCSEEACPGLGPDLKQHLARLEEALSSSVSSEALSATDQGVQKHLREWGRSASGYYREKATEVKELLIVMARTAESFGARDSRYATQLKEVTGRLERIATLEDLTEIRASIQRNAAELKASVQTLADEGNRVIAELQSEITAYRARLEEAEESMSRDLMTGLCNRRCVEKQIERRIGSSVPFCVAIIDINGFKHVNDEHGHIAGDELLQQFAAGLQSASRSTDVIGRWGGDEFILVLDGSLPEASAQIERLTGLVCRDYNVHARIGALQITVDASTGLAEHVSGETMKELLTRADTAMYARKRAALDGGGNQHLSVAARTGEAPISDQQWSNTVKSLVAEDDASTRKLLQIFLSGFGECDIALDGREAVEMCRLTRAKKQRYDLICMDLRMPHMDGLEAIREIRKQEEIDGVAEPARIIVTTAHTDIESVNGALLGHCDAYLAKPIDTARLRTELRDLGLIE